MSSFRTGQVLLFLSTLAVLPALGSQAHRTHTSKRKPVSHLHGQRVIDSPRATEIQNALIQKKYLGGAASGQWDTQTQDAMRQYQSDHGWQTKLMPDSRALISLGLGPNHTEDPAMRSPAVTSAAPSAENTDQVQSAQPIANTLASVHSIAQ